MRRGVSDECRVKRTEKNMKRQLTVLTLCVMFLAPCVSAEAQQPNKVPRIGYLSDSNPTRESARSKAIGLALRELGYTKGKNITTEYRYAEGGSIGLQSLRPSW